MQKQAKQYSVEEKAQVAVEAIKGDLTLAQISSEYGVYATQIARWKREAIDSMVGRFKVKTKIKDTSKKELIRYNYLYEL
jgi:transposase